MGHIIISNLPKQAHKTNMYDYLQDATFEKFMMKFFQYVL